MNKVKRILIQTIAICLITAIFGYMASSEGNEMDELYESECNAMTSAECCDICGKLIGSEWQINHPGTILCEHCATKELYDEDV